MNETDFLASMSAAELAARRESDWLEQAYDQNGEPVKWLFRHWGPGGGTYKLQRKYQGKTLKDSHRTKDIVVAIERHRVHPYVQVSVQTRPNDDINCADAFAKMLAEHPGKADTLTTMKSNWKAHCEGLFLLKFTQVTPQNIIDVVDPISKPKDEIDPVTGRAGKGLSPGMKRNVTNTIGRLFTHFCHEPYNWRSDNPVHRIGTHNKVPMAETVRVPDEVFVTEEEMERWVAAAARPIGTYFRNKDERRVALQTATLIELSYESGPRLGEIGGLRVTPADLLLDVKPLGKFSFTKQLSKSAVAGKPETWYAPMKGAKVIGGKQRDVPMTERGREVLDHYLTVGRSEGWLRDNGPLWPSKTGAPTSKGTLQGRIAAARDRAGIVRIVLDEAGNEVEDDRLVTHHSLRHTFASNLYKAGWQIDQIAGVLGNTPEVCRTRYAHVQEDVEFNTAFAAVGRKAKATPVESNVVQFPERRAA